MIQNSFIILPGLGLSREKKIWESGVRNWEDFLKAERIKGINPIKKRFYDKCILRARKELYAGNSAYFCKILKRSEQWRLYEFFKEETVFLDIETMGNSKFADLLMVGLYDANTCLVKSMVKGYGLTKRGLAEELLKYKMIATFNGGSFDLPFIDRFFRKTVPEVPHFDVMVACRRVGLTGGLKAVEEKLKISRNTAGIDVVGLWQEYKATGDKETLQQIVDYNEEDVVNLKKVADVVYGRMPNLYNSPRKI